MRTGIVNPNDEIISYSDTYQDVYIPSDADSVVLGFWIYPISEEAKLGYLETLLQPFGPLSTERILANDLQYMLVLIGPNFNFKWSDLRDTQSWEYRTVFLNEYLGQTIGLDFGTYNDGWDGVSAMYVDDVTLTICR